jgi:hypothetical protein
VVRAALAVLAGAAVLAAEAVGAPPRAGLVVPGRSLGGLELGVSRAEVRDAWGGRFGACRGCPQPTWYFNYRQFEPQGVGVTFRGGRAVALFTIWAPLGWRTTRGLRIGDDESRVAALHGPLLRVSCGTYGALTMRGRTGTTAVYVHDGRVWGFGLSRPGLSPCR